MLSHARRHPAATKMGAVRGPPRSVTPTAAPTTSTTRRRAQPRARGPRVTPAAPTGAPAARLSERSYLESVPAPLSPIRVFTHRSTAPFTRKTRKTLGMGLLPGARSVFATWRVVPIQPRRPLRSSNYVSPRPQPWASLCLSPEGAMTLGFAFLTKPRPPTQVGSR